MIKESLILVGGGWFAYLIVAGEEVRHERNSRLDADRSVVNQDALPHRLQTRERGVENIRLAIVMPSCLSCSAVQYDYSKLAKREGTLLIFPDQKSRDEFNIKGRWSTVVAGQEMNVPYWLWNSPPSFFEVKDGVLTRRIEPSIELGLSATIPSLDLDDIKGAK